jgi:high-affinity iron transporter
MWDDAFPSYLIGLREGLEGGLIVSILVPTLVRAGARSRLPQVWTGVLAAIALAMSFGAVLTFTAASLSATAQEAFGGTLSMIAVAFVTAMVEPRHGARVLLLPAGCARPVRGHTSRRPEAATSSPCPA